MVVIMASSNSPGDMFFTSSHKMQPRLISISSTPAIAANPLGAPKQMVQEAIAISLETVEKSKDGQMLERQLFKLLLPSVFVRVDIDSEMSQRREV